MRIVRFEDIEAWQFARELTRKVYEATKNQYFFHDYGLKDQIRRASVSAMSNIAEGFDSGTNAEFARFLCYAQRSCSEVQSHLYIALDQAYIDKPEFKNIYSSAAKTRATIGGFIKYLKNTSKKQQE